MRPPRSALEGLLRSHTADFGRSFSASRRVPRAVFRTLRGEMRDLGMTRREARRAAKVVRRQAKALGKRSAQVLSEVDWVGLLLEAALTA